jgi:hypothetical protein
MIAIPAEVSSVRIRILSEISNPPDASGIRIQIEGHNKICHQVLLFLKMLINHKQFKVNNIQMHIFSINRQGLSIKLIIVDMKAIFSVEKFRSLAIGKQV